MCFAKLFKTKSVSIWFTSLVFLQALSLLSWLKLNQTCYRLAGREVFAFRGGLKVTAVKGEGVCSIQ